MEEIESQEIERKKRSLKRYKKTLTRIGRLRKKIMALDHKIGSMRSPNYSGMPRGGVPVSIDDLISDKMDLEERITRLKNNSRILKKEILSEIDSLDDDRYCELLEAYFIDNIPFELIAENMGYTERHIYTLYREAIIALIKNSE